MIYNILLAIFVSGTSAAFLKGKCLMPGDPGAPVHVENINIEQFVGNQYIQVYDLEGLANITLDCFQTQYELVPGSVQQQNFLQKEKEKTKNKKKDLAKKAGGDNEQESDDYDDEYMMYYYDDQFSYVDFEGAVGELIGHHTGVCPKTGMRSGFITTNAVNLEGPAYYDWETFGKVLFTGWIVDVVPNEYHIAYHCSQKEGNLGLKQELFAIQTTDPDISDKRKKELIQIAYEKITQVQQEGLKDDSQNEVYDVKKHGSEVKQGTDQCKYIPFQKD